MLVHVDYQKLSTCRNMIVATSLGDTNYYNTRNETERPKHRI